MEPRTLLIQSLSEGGGKTGNVTNPRGFARRPAGFLRHPYGILPGHLASNWSPDWHPVPLNPIGPIEDPKTGKMLESSRVLRAAARF